MELFIMGNNILIGIVVLFSALICGEFYNNWIITFITGMISTVIILFLVEKKQKKLISQIPKDSLDFYNHKYDLLTKSGFDFFVAKSLARINRVGKNSTGKSSVLYIKFSPVKNDIEYNKEITQRIKISLRKSDIVANDKDYIIVYLEEVLNDNDVIMLTKRIINNITARYDTFSPECSVGVAITEGVTDVDTIITKAKKNMFIAKNQGKNQFNFI